MIAIIARARVGCNAVCPARCQELFFLFLANFLPQGRSQSARVGTQGAKGEREGGGLATPRSCEGFPRFPGSAGHRQFYAVGRARSTTVAYLRLKIELALEFWTFGRGKSTTVAHFGLKMELALGFRGADERHARILEPPGTESTQLSSILTCRRAGSEGLGLRLSGYTFLTLTR